MAYLWFYRGLSGFRFLNFRGKVMVVAFLGTHVPLIALIGWAAAGTSTGWGEFLGTLSVALAATLAGSAATLFALHHLLRPVVAVARALRRYRTERAVAELPTGFTDEIGRLMRDAADTLTHLEATRTRLEEIDAATEIPNRHRFLKDIAARFEASAPFAVCLLRFESYDRIARTISHEAAEAAMGKLAGRLDSFLGAEAGLARPAADALAFLAERPAGAAAAGAAAAGADAAGADAAGADAEETLRETLEDLIMVAAAPLHVAELSLSPALNAGIARAGIDADEPEALLDCAALAAQPDGAFSRVTVFSPTVREAARETLRIEQDLRTALDADQLLLHFQPVVDFDRAQAVSAEALIRWQHPEIGMVSPGRFIPVAEKSGLIVPIGLWVLDTVCAQLAAWNAAGPAGQRVAVNLSAAHFQDPRLVEAVERALGNHGVAPGQLEIELTESAATSDHAYTRAVFGQLRELGVGIAIDDFGTGFASLSQLRRLPFDKLKIDREFVTAVPRRRDSQAICGALIALGRGLEIDVLAEGTETAEEIGWLHAQGCRLFQGFGFARPMPADRYAGALSAGDLGTTTAGLRARIAV